MGAHLGQVQHHRLAEERSLAYHHAVCERLEGNLVLLALARAQAWVLEGRSASYAARWAELLAGPRDALICAMLDPSDAGRALRQCTPFAGALPPAERWLLWSAVRKSIESR